MVQYVNVNIHSLFKLFSGPIKRFVAAEDIIAIDLDEEYFV